MKQKRLSIVILCLVAGTALSQPTIKTGEAFPTLVLPKLSDGSPGSITEYRGEKVILHVFASW